MDRIKEISARAEAAKKHCVCNACIPPNELNNMLLFEYEDLAKYHHIDDIPWLIEELERVTKERDEAIKRLELYVDMDQKLGIDSLRAKLKLADACLEIFENRRKLAYFMRNESREVYAFVEAIGSEIDKIRSGAV